MISTPAMDRWAVCALALTVAALGVGCSSQPNDRQIVNSIQTQLQKDSVAGNEVKVESAQGVVTLSGQVPSDAARVLAAREASTAPGVREVINNLTVTPPPAPTTAAVPEPQQNRARPGPMRRHRAAAARPSREEAVADKTPQPAPAEAASPAPAPAPVASAPPAAAVAPPPPPPQPVKHTIPAGTVLSVRLVDTLDSSRNRVGDTFRATLNAPLRMDGDVVIPAGANVEGRVADVSNAGRYSGHSELKLELTKLTYHGEVYPLNTADYGRADAGRGKGSAETVGGGAALGAIIGAIAGGGKGAAIGTVAGAGAGGVARGVGKGQPVRFPSETVLSFKLQEPLTVVTMPGKHASDDSARAPMSPDRP